MGNGPWDFVKSSSLKKNWLGNSSKRERRGLMGRGAKALREKVLSWRLSLRLSLRLLSVVCCGLRGRSRPSPTRSQQRRAAPVPRATPAWLDNAGEDTRELWFRAKGLGMLWYRCGNSCCCGSLPWPLSCSPRLQGGTFLLIACGRNRASFCTT